MIDFMRFRRVYFLVSALVIVPGVVSLFVFGLRPAIDFVGGTLWEVKLERSPSSLSDVEQALKEKGLVYSSVQRSGENGILVKLPPASEDDKNEAKELLAAKFGGVEELRFETVGPTLGRELLIKTLVGVVLAALFILLYIAYQFKDRMYGVSAILAMFHDSLVVIGIFSLLGHFLKVEIDTLFVTALLTVLSFSVHDTVVVYDRIRESVKTNPNADFVFLANKAVNETMVRSLNNSLTIIFMLLALFLLGGAGVRWFAFALLVGTVSGTYSSPFTAVPLLIVWRGFRERLKAAV